MHPVWEHSCKLMPYSGNGSGDKIKFQVTELVDSGLWVWGNMGRPLKTKYHGGLP